MACQRNVEKLLDFINSRQAVPYEWGKNDCVTYVLGAVEAQTGKKVTKLKWHDSKSALGVLKRYKTLEHAFDLHFKRIPPSMAKRGDIAGIADDVFGIHTGIVEGEKIVGPGDKGNKRFPRKVMICAWSACC